MAAIDETTVDVEDVIRRIQAVHRGEMPEGSVSIEELRAALAAQRKRFAGGMSTGTASDASAPERKRVSTKKKLIVDLGGL